MQHRRSLFLFSLSAAVFSVLCSLSAIAADEAVDTRLVARIQSQLPSGYTVLAIGEGDLNRDPYPDILVVLKHRSEDKGAEEAPRPVLVFINQRNRGYRLAARGDSAVMCKGCGGAMGDPFTGIAIKRGYFTLEHYGGSSWRWTHFITFKYNRARKNWFLHKEGGDSFHIGNPKKVTTSFTKIDRSRPISLQKFDYNKSK